MGTAVTTRPISPLKCFTITRLFAAVGDWSDWSDPEYRLRPRPRAHCIVAGWVRRPRRPTGIATPGPHRRLLSAGHAVRTVLLNSRHTIVTYDSLKMAHLVRWGPGRLRRAAKSYHRWDWPAFSEQNTANRTTFSYLNLEVENQNYFVVKSDHFNEFMWSLLPNAS